MKTHIGQNDNPDCGNMIDNPDPNGDDFFPEANFFFVLDVDDADAYHTHTDRGHRFPCTRAQLEELLKQISAALGEHTNG